MILKNLIRRSTRSLLTVIGIAIGVAAVVSLGSMATGMTESYGGALGLSNDLLVTQANSYDAALSNLDEDLGQRIQAISDVENVDAGVFGWIAVGNNPFFLIYGYEPGSVAIDHYRIVEGKPVSGPKQMVLGSRAAASLKKGIDDTIRMNGAPYRIVGIYETGQAMEESGGLVTLEEAQNIMQKNRKVSLFQVGVRPGANLDQIKERISLLDSEISVSVASDYDAGQSWTSMLQGVAWGISAIAVLIGGLGMMSAMVMSVMERTREIGTLRAVGWRRSQVLRMILGEALGLSLVGGVIGVALGFFLAWAVGLIPGMGSFLAGAFSFGIAAQGMLTAILLGIVGGLYPAWSAADLQPVEALRYEGGATSDVQGALAHIGNQSFRNLWRRRTRTLISAAGIGIGVATLVMLGGLVDGLIGQLNGLAGSGGTGSITVMQADVADMSLSSLDERMVNAIQAMPQVKTTSPFVLAIIMTPELPFFMAGGIDLNSPALQHYKLIEGRYVQRPNEVVLGKTAAQNYKLGVGDTLVVNDSRYKIVGMFETGVAWEDGGGVLSLREAQRLMGRPRTVSYIFVDVVDPSQAKAVAAAINARFPGVRASLSSEFAQNTNDIQLTGSMTTAIQVLAMIVGGVVVANTMIMAIYERTREIGTLRAVGWKRRRILSQVMQESLLLCFVSAIFGCVLGVVIVSLLAVTPGANAFVSPVWKLSTFTSAIAVALLLGVIGGLYPAWRASHFQPVEALRYE